MILTQHYLACLSHASYLIGDETTGRAVVVDPRRDVGVYLQEAAERGLTIERVIETHVHADFLSGHLELAARTGAVISYGDGADVDFPIEPLHDGQRLSLGEVTLEILATPGHTPESICVVVLGAPGRPGAVRRADRRHPVRRRRRPSRPAGLGRRRPVRRGAGPAAVPVAARQAAGAARRHPGLPGPRRGLGVRQGAVDRDDLDDRRAAADQLRAAGHGRGRVRRRGHRGPARPPPLLRLRRPANREPHPLLDEHAPPPARPRRGPGQAGGGAVLLDAGSRPTSPPATCPGR